ncbi:hypothetical protein THRCLA_06443 [Thraustotheca clavata]|uniref:DUF4246 domain-containing protein n=1 Tax=Thraustotheca clavata TaxID=74557 RepID=A0A1V9ZNQ9_9STRA|nr:hypothetical protein THRCLA_06443 [Thraustotheca clavata]
MDIAKELRSAVDDNNGPKLHELVRAHAVAPLLLEVDENGTTLLMKAASKGHVNAVRELAPLSNVNAQDKNGATAMYLAACNGHDDVIKELLTKQANIELSNDEGRTPFMAAVANKHLQTVKLLCKHTDINAQDKNKWTALMIAVAEPGNADIVKWLIRIRAIAKCVNFEGCSALHFACQSANTEYIELLVGHSNVNAINKAFQTPLSLCAQCSNAAAAIDLLLEHNADANHQDMPNLKTPLHNACMFGDGRNIQALVKKSNLELKDKEKKVALEYLALERIERLIPLLSEDQRAVVANLQGQDGSTFVQKALASGNETLAIALLPFANMSLTNHSVENLTDLALSKKLLSVVDCLERVTRSFWVPTTKSMAQRDASSFRVVDYVYTLAELEYMHALCEVVNKPHWYIKYLDPTIRSKWQTELHWDDKKFNFLMEELDFYMKIFKLNDGGSIIPISSNGVYITDRLVESSLVNELKALLTPLEAKAIERGDYHPMSDDQVIDIVHPSMYCAVYGRTKYVLPPKSSNDTPVGDQVLIWKEQWETSYLKDISKAFQWLPTPIKVDTNGNASFTSYINNIHPSQTTLYNKLQELFSIMLPLFELTIAATKQEPLQRYEVAHCVEEYSTSEEELAYARHVLGPDADEDHELYDEVDFYGEGYLQFRWTLYNQAKEAGKEDVQPPIDFPKLQDHFPIPTTPIPSNSLVNSTLQVITKVATIQLTPEKPKYAGGSWHIEGMANEAIVATGILYYDMHNITSSKLQFRQAFAEDIELGYEQSRHLGIEQVYGLRNEEPSVQQTGFITALEGRCVVFPNFQQHRVAPFELIDLSMPGHRKIIAFFLIDPSLSLLSTANVPPQQHEWLVSSLAEAIDQSPIEALANMSSMTGSMTHEEAREFMVQLMQERQQSQEFLAQDIPLVSLCEH